MAGAAIIFHDLNGWVTTTSSSGGVVAFRRLITTQRALIRMTETRM